MKLTYIFDSNSANFATVTFTDQNILPTSGQVVLRLLKSDFNPKAKSAASSLQLCLSRILKHFQSAIEQSTSRAHEFSSAGHADFINSQTGQRGYQFSFYATYACVKHCKYLIQNDLVSEDSSFVFGDKRPRLHIAMEDFKNSLLHLEDLGIEFTSFLELASSPHAVKAINDGFILNTDDLQAVLDPAVTSKSKSTLRRI